MTYPASLRPFARTARPTFRTVVMRGVTALCALALGAGFSVVPAINAAAINGEVHPGYLFNGRSVAVESTWWMVSTITLPASVSWAPSTVEISGWIMAERYGPSAMSGWTTNRWAQIGWIDWAGTGYAPEEFIQTYSPSRGVVTSFGSKLAWGSTITVGISHTIDTGNWSEWELSGTWRPVGTQSLGFNRTSAFWSLDVESDTPTGTPPHIGRTSWTHNLLGSGTTRAGSDAGLTALPAITEPFQWPTAVPHLSAALHPGAAPLGAVNHPALSTGTSTPKGHF